MLRLRTLGGLTIEDENGPLAGAIARKRSLALLALVGLSTEQGVSRDRVLAYLWPESDTERARNNLKQTLFQLRQDLHEDVFAKAAGVLRLEPSAISVDACDFQAAIDRGNPTTAVTLYRGPFLDGFYLPGLAEFERWVESERVRLDQRYAGALEAMAATATRLGDHLGAADWWRRLAAHDPLSARNAIGLMQALAQAGDRAAALEHARVYQELVRGEFDSEPDPEVTEYVKQLRGKLARWTGSVPPKPTAPRQSPAPDAAPAVQPGPSAQGPAEPVVPVSEPSAVAAETVPTPAVAPGPDAPGRSRRLVGLGLALVVLAGVWLGDRSASGSPVSPDLVAVFPFSFAGTGESRFLGNGMVDLLSAGLDGAGELRSVHPSAYLAQVARQGTEPLDAQRALDWARRLGTQLYVLGDIVATHDRVQISAAMYDRSRKDAVARASVEGETAGLFQLVDRLAAGLIASRYGQPHERLTRVAAGTTRSLPALKAYLEGEQAYRDGRFPEAIETLEKAVGTDSTFALAYYRLSDAADRAGRPERAQSSAQQAFRYREQLGERERRLIEAQHAWRLGRSAEAEGLCRSLVADYPDDVEAWLQLGEVLVHGNPLRGRSTVEARPAFEQALARDPDNGEALIHLARIASIQGNRHEVDTLVRRARSAVQGTEVVETRAFRAFVLGDRPGQKRITQKILANPGGVPAVTALDVAVMADDLEGTERFGRWLTGASRAPDLRAYGHRMLAQAKLARGQWRRAQGELTTAARLDPIPALELRSLFASFSFLPLPQSEIIAVREEVRRWNAESERLGQAGHTSAHSGLHPYLRLHRLGLLDTRLGDTVSALRNARALERVADSSAAGRLAHTLAQSIRARIAAAGGRAQQALADLDAAGWEAAASVFAAEAYDRYFRAELLERANREDEALGWFRSMAERAAYELVYLAPSHLRQAQIYDRRGERNLAARHYRRFIDLWRDADPELQPVVEGARSRLAALQ
ncbi:MAG TPA: BTAD domain-containing putative transcriptional regulator [Gemmatimonadales bacterium]|nr:BTAD domain-containing putative transcriptional regulator [Gemmatimonadales bacterium]